MHCCDALLWCTSLHGTSLRHCDALLCCILWCTPLHGMYNCGHAVWPWMNENLPRFACWQILFCILSAPYSRTNAILLALMIELFGEHKMHIIWSYLFHSPSQMECSAASAAAFPVTWMLHLLPLLSLLRIVQMHTSCQHFDCPSSAPWSSVRWRQGTDALWVVQSTHVRLFLFLFF